MQTLSKPTRRVVLALSVILLLIVVVASFGHKPFNGLRIGGSSFDYEVAQTVAAREQGLSGRTSLDQKQAMLFVFQGPDKYCFWMKGMRFSIDMMWLNTQKQVVYIKDNVAPDTYPDSFCPDKDAQYVVEVSAGTLQKTGIKVGDTVRF